MEARHSASLNPCAERSRLLIAASDAALSYSAAARGLAEQVDALGKADYARVRKQAEQLWLDARNARKALHAHCAEHGC